MKREFKTAPAAGNGGSLSRKSVPTPLKERAACDAAIVMDYQYKNLADAYLLHMNKGFGIRGFGWVSFASFVHGLVS